MYVYRSMYHLGRVPLAPVDPGEARADAHDRGADRLDQVRRQLRVERRLLHVEVDESGCLGRRVGACAESEQGFDYTCIPISIYMGVL